MIHYKRDSFSSILQVMKIAINRNTMNKKVEQNVERL